MDRAHALLHLVHEGLDLLRRDEAILDELPRVLLADRGVLLDELVHERLRVARLVALVVAEAPVADEVDDDVVPEACPKAMASRIAETAASGSSAFTCTIGVSNSLARSLEKRVERPSSGSVVNPTWLLAMMR